MIGPKSVNGTQLLVSLIEAKAAVPNRLKLSLAEQLTTQRRKIEDIDRKISQGKSVPPGLRQRVISRIQDLADMLAAGRVTPNTRSISRVPWATKHGKTVHVNLGPGYQPEERKPVLCAR